MMTAAQKMDLLVKIGDAIDSTRQAIKNASPPNVRFPPEVEMAIKNAEYSLNATRLMANEANLAMLRELRRPDIQTATGEGEDE